VRTEKSEAVLDTEKLKAALEELTKERERRRVARGEAPPVTGVSRGNSGSAPTVPSEPSPEPTVSRSRVGSTSKLRHRETMAFLAK
jgi:hypothetical protein